MKYAAAMKYGGELVDALECDYSAFKQLVPLCPNCKEPVYLRAGGERAHPKDENKTVLVQPHWCHFKGISQEQVASCESRVNGYSEKDRRRIASKARNQRYKLLTRWAIYVLNNSSCFDSGNAERSLMELKKAKNTAAAIDGITQELRKNVKDFRGVFFKLTPSVFLDQAKQTRLDYCTEDQKAFEEGISGLQDLVRLDTSELNRRQKYSAECFDFLCAQRQSELISMMAACLIMFELKASGPPKTIEQLSIECFLYCYAVLMTIDWASEFQRLEAESQERKAS